MRPHSAMTAIGTLVVIAMAACSETPAREFGKPDVESIQKMLQEFVTVYNAKDAVKLVNFFTPGGAVLPPNASTVRGTENVREYYVRRFARGASDLVLEPEDIEGSWPLAFANGNYRLKMAPPGGEARPDRGKFLFVLRDIKGHWLLDQLMFSSDFAPDQASAPKN